MEGTSGICVDGRCAVQVCGNNAIEADEVCDDGNRRSGRPKYAATVSSTMPKAATVVVRLHQIRGAQGLTLMMSTPNAPSIAARASVVTVSKTA